MGKAVHLYVIANDDGAHKVGTSVAPQRRLSQLQIGSARQLRLARTMLSPVPDADAVEAYAHWLLRASQAVGEWFAVTEEAAWVALVAAAEAVARGERAPERIAGVGRKMLWPDKIVAPLPKGSLARMAAVLGPEEDKTDFLREAVERELKRREKAPKRSD